jgi:hypothetical protein
VLTVRSGDKEALLHLYENGHEELCLWTLGVGREASIQKRPAFEGRIESVEITFVGGELLWDFRSMLLVNEASEVRIERYDASFPEPTLRFAGGVTEREQRSV